MYIDIAPNDNLGEPAMATFKETGPSRAVRAVRLSLDEGWRWCAVVGWDEAGPQPAALTPIEESGDGPARLLHGGEHGLRLARLPEGVEPQAAAAQVRWSIADAAQWAEPFLICRPDTEAVGA